MATVAYPVVQSDVKLWPFHDTAEVHGKPMVLIKMAWHEMTATSHPPEGCFSDVPPDACYTT